MIEVPGTAAEGLAPIGRRARWLSVALALVAATASALGLAFAGVFHDTPMTVGNARGTGLAVLVAAVPMLVAGIVLTAQGSLLGRALWLSAVAYLLYNSVLFCFALAFNSFFLLYVAMLGLALWSLVDLLRQTDVDRFAAGFSKRAPVRPVAGFMALCAALFGYTWLRDIIPALLDNTSPESFARSNLLTNPAHVLDLSITLPMLVLGAVWLWQRRPWGYLVSSILVVMLTVETFGVALDQIFGHRADPEQSLGAVPLMLGLTVVGLAFSVLLLWGTRRINPTVAGSPDS